MICNEIVEIKKISPSKENSNFILPRTEATISSIIADIEKLLDRIRICASIIYMVYLCLRLALFSLNKILDIVYISIAVLQFVILLFYVFKKIKFTVLSKTIKFIKFIPPLGMFCLVVGDIFSDLTRLQSWQIILTIFIGIGWGLLILGDLFMLFVPKYTERMLTSFKQDIELKDLASRSMHQIVDTAKDAIKSEQGKKVVKIGIAMTAAVFIGKALKIFLRRR